jgi:predicted nuclease of predicted toxin-antitoxin system
MRLLLDQGLPRSTVHHLDAAGVESAHVGEKGLATASDAKIIDFARQGGWIVVTLDADFPCSVGALWGDWPIRGSHSDRRSTGRGACHFTG